MNLPIYLYESAIFCTFALVRGGWWRRCGQVWPAFLLFSGKSPMRKNLGTLPKTVLFLATLGHIASLQFLAERRNDL